MDAEKVIKALECCGDKICKHCPNYSEDIECSEKLIKEALDFIKLQQAEIERLKSICASNNEIINNQGMEIARRGKILKFYALQYGTVTDKIKVVNDIKAEAYKEFAERLKRYLLLSKIGQISVVSFENIDSLVKELTEGSNEN